MITKKTLPTIIVPIIAPTCRNAARGEKSSHDTHADAQMKAKTSNASSPSLSPNARQSPSYTSHDATSRPIEIAIASVPVRSATERSTRYVDACE